MKKILLGLMLFIGIILPAVSSDLSITEKAFNNALTSIPKSYEYKEESGALFFIQKKNYRFNIINNGNSFEQLVTYSSTQDEKVKAEDPRPSIREGDSTRFYMEQLLCEANLFSPASSLDTDSGKTLMSSGKRYRMIEVSYNYCDAEGQVWPMVGELLVHQTSGIPFKLTVEQQIFPEDVYSISVEVDFDGTYSSNCRIAECRKYQTGQHGIFKYKYNTILNFVY